MASLDSGDSGSHKKGPGVKKAKKLSTRVDMTPMVDLGFLLITFFIFTATMSEPKAMDLNMPKDQEKPEDEMKTKESGALTIMLGKNDQVYYYHGKLEEDASNFKQTTFKGIRDEIIKKKKDVVSRYNAGTPAAQKCEAEAGADKKKLSDCRQQDFFIVIKPNSEATYKNTVDILDEMAINDVARYAMVKISPVENELIKRTEGSAGR